MASLPSHGSYFTSPQCLLERMTCCKHQQGLCSTLLFPDTALTISRLLQKHPKEIMSIELGTSEVALPDQGYVPGVVTLTSQWLLCKSFLTSGSKHFQGRRGGTPRTGAAPAVRQQKGMSAGLEAGGMSPSCQWN